MNEYKEYIDGLIKALEATYYHIRELERIGAENDKCIFTSEAKSIASMIADTIINHSFKNDETPSK